MIRLPQEIGRLLGIGAAHFHQLVHGFRARHTGKVLWRLKITDRKVCLLANVGIEISGVKRADRPAQAVGHTGISPSASTQQPIRNGQNSRCVAMKI